MSAELKLAQEKIKELEAKLAKVSANVKAATPLHVLPNGDLHRGVQFEGISDPDNENIPLSAADPLNAAMAVILKTAKGGKNLTCTWCGIQFDGMYAEKSIREHLTKDHPSVVNKAPDAAVLMANLDEAQKALAEAK